MNRKPITGVFVALAALLAVAPLLGGSPVRADEKVTPIDRMFARTVAQTNLAEVMTSRLALQKSRNDKVERVARMLIEGHTRAQNDLRSVARTHNMRLPQEPNAEQKAMYRRLSRLSGAAFDKMYMAGQVRGHNATVALFKEYMEKGNETHVRSYAAKYLPDIENHTQMIHNVAGNLGIPVTAAAAAGR